MSTQPQISVEEQIIDDIGQMTHRPTRFMRYAYEWERGDLAGSTGVRPWQRDVLKTIEQHLTNPKTRHQPCQVAVSSGHGIGKSALVAMLTTWALSSCEDCKVILTANTKTQLDTKTAPEVAKWLRMSINAHWWERAMTSIKVRDARHAATWRADFIPWSVQNSEAFAGLHNKGKRIVLIFDEASAIDDVIWQVAEGALTDEDTEIIWLAFGNPTQNTGRFRECFGSRKHRWYTYQIDSRNVEGTNKDQIAKWITDYGEDSDFVRVRVRGEFPRAGSQQLISSEDVAYARKYRAAGYETLPKVLGIDVARFGDDETSFAHRQGRFSTILSKHRGLDVAQVTAQAIAYITEHEYDAVVVDSDGIGAPVYDNLKFRGYGKRLFDFHGGKPANNHAAYFNRRAEVWGTMRDWLKAGAQIDDDPELEQDLIGPQYGFSAQNQLQLEKKDDMKVRGLSSPDDGDALAMTFAVMVAAPPAKKKTEYVYPGQLERSWMG